MPFRGHILGEGGAFGTFLPPIFLKIPVLESNTKAQGYF